MDNNFDKRLKDSKECIKPSQRNNPDEIYLLAHEKKYHKPVFKYIIKYSLAFMIIIFVSFLIVNVDTTYNFGPEKEKFNSLDKTRNKLYTYLSNYNEIEQLFYQYDDNTLNFDLGIINNINNVLNNDKSFDFIKQYNDYVYYIPKKSNSNSLLEKLYIFKVNEGKLVIDKVFNYDFKNEVIFKDLYVTDNYFILHTLNYDDYDKYSVSKLLIYDINTYTLKKELSIPSINTIVNVNGNDLYLLAIYNDFSNDFMAPNYYIDGYKYKTDLTNVLWCNRFGNQASYYLMIFKISLDNNIIIDSYMYLLPNLDNIYISDKYIYLLNNEELQAKLNGKIVKTINTKCVLLDLNDSLLPKTILTFRGECNRLDLIKEKEDKLIVSTVSTYNYGSFENNVFISSDKEVISYITCYSLNDFEEKSQLKINSKIDSMIVNDNIITLTEDDIRYYNLTNDKLSLDSKVNISLDESTFKFFYKDKYLIEIDKDALDNSKDYFDFIKVYNFEGLFVKKFSISIDHQTNLFVDFSEITPEKSFIIDYNNDLIGISTLCEVVIDSNVKYFNNYIIFKLDIDANELSVLKEITFVNDYSDTKASQIERMICIGDYYYLFGMNKIMVYEYLEDDFINIQTINLTN